VKGNVPSPNCPKCNTENPKAIHSWRITAAHKIAEPPQPMWACLNPTCLHKWPKESTD